MVTPLVAGILGGSSLLGGIFGSRGASKAARAQTQAAKMGIAEQRRQFDFTREQLAPYAAAGPGALEQQQALVGLLGPEAQQQAIAGVESSPLLQSLMRQGEEAMLQNAAVTGGLRGGNLQEALAQFRPAMLQNALDQYYARLGGLTSLGQQSAAGVAGAGMQTGQNIAGLLEQAGAARAGGALGQASAWSNLFNLPMQMYGLNIARGGSGNLFGGTSAPSLQPVEPGISGIPSWAVLPPPG